MNTLTPSAPGSPDASPSAAHVERAASLWRLPDGCASVARSRAALFVGVGAALAASLLVLLIQLGLVGAWRIGAEVPSIPWQPVAQAPLEALPDGSWRLPPGRDAGGLLATGIEVQTDRLLGVASRIEAHGQPVEVEIAWLRIGRERPDTARFRLPPTAHDRTVLFDLSGHRHWHGPISRIAVAVRAPQTPAGAFPWTSGAPELVAATPSAGLLWLQRGWFEASRVLEPIGEPTRRLPLAVLGAAAMALLGVAGILARRRIAPTRFAAAQLGAVLAFAGVAGVLVVALLGTRIVAASGVLVGLLALSVPLLAFIVPDGANDVPRPTGQRELWSLRLVPLVVLAALLLLAWLRPWLGLASATGLAAWALGQRFGPQGRGAVLAVLMLVLLAILAAVQNIGSTFGLSDRLASISVAPRALNDPTPALATMVKDGWVSSLASLLCIALLALWPRADARAVGEGASASSSVLPSAILAAVVAGGTVALALATDSPAHPELLAPVSGWLVHALLGRMAQPLPSEATNTNRRPVALSERSEAVQQLYAAAAQAFLSSAARGELGDARRHHERMIEIAADEPETRWAALALALAEKRVETAEEHYRALGAALPLLSRHVPAEQMHFTLYEVAWARADRDLLMRLEPILPNSPTRTRIRCFLALTSEGPEAMYRVLEEAGFPPELAIERIECALLLDDIERAKQALEASGIPIESVAGHCYFARLKLRALGPAAAEAEILKLATWHSDFALAQIAMGELLVRQGQIDAARTRFRSAAHLEDPALWPHSEVSGVRGARLSPSRGLSLAP